MSVDIPADLQHFVQSMIARGSFGTETEVVGEALRLLQNRQRRLEELRAEIQPALDQLDRGEYIDLDDEGLKKYFEEIKVRGGLVPSPDTTCQENGRGTMAIFRLGPQARVDLDGIYDHIAPDNTSAADRLMDRFYAKFALLATQPLLGELRPELAENLRSVVVGNYVILYRPTGDSPQSAAIEVARVLHAARDIGSVF